MFCQKCGSQLPDCSTFCNMCGTSLISQTTSEIQNAQPAYDQYGQLVQPGFDSNYASTYNAPKKSNAKWFIIGGVAVVAIIAVVLIIILTGGNDTTTDESAVKIDSEIIGSWSNEQDAEYKNGRKVVYTYVFNDDGSCQTKNRVYSDGDIDDYDGECTYTASGNDLIFITKATEGNDTYERILNCKYNIHDNTLTITYISVKTLKNGEVVEEEDELNEKHILTKQY